MRVLFYLTLLTLSCAYALWRGGWPERAVALMLVAQTVAVLAAKMLLAPYGFLEVIIPDFLIDLLFLAGLLAVAMTADRFWPIPMVGLQGATVAAHLARVVDPSITSIAYGTMMAVWSYPMLFLLALGTVRHRRRLKDSGFDRDWSAQAGPTT